MILGLHTMIYNIVTRLEVFGQNRLDEAWANFCASEAGDADLILHIGRADDAGYDLDLLPPQPGPAVLCSGDYLLSVNPDWSEAAVTLLGRENELDLSRVLNALLMSHLSTRGALLMHASLIDVKGRGILFLGSSGIGKTTQAELWMRYAGAEIVNGDMVYVKREQEQFLGCGSPWHGSSEYCLNRQVPLAGMVVLGQSRENAIRRLTDMEMITAVMSNVFFPKWYREGYEAVCDTLDALLQTVPVFELFCRPDEDAVRMTEEMILNI